MQNVVLGTLIVLESIVVPSRVSDVRGLTRFLSRHAAATATIRRRMVIGTLPRASRSDGQTYAGLIDLRGFERIGDFPRLMCARSRRQRPPTAEIWRGEFVPPWEWRK